MVWPIKLAVSDELQPGLDVDAKRDAGLFGDGLIEIGDAARRLADVEFAHPGAIGPRFGARDHQKRVEHFDQPVGFFDRPLERGAIIRLVAFQTKRRFGVIAQARQRRAQIMGDIVGDFAAGPPSIRRCGRAFR